MSSVFVDTSAWLAVMDRSEERHEIARDFFLKLLGNKTKLVTSNYVLPETYTRIRYDAGHSYAIRFHDIIISASQRGDLQVVWVTPSIADEAWEIFEKYEDQLFSFTDCTSFVIAGESKVKEVFAFDEDFKIMGYIVEPTSR